MSHCQNIETKIGRDGWDLLLLLFGYFVSVFYSGSLARVDFFLFFFFSLFLFFLLCSLFNSPLSPISDEIDKKVTILHLIFNYRKNTVTLKKKKIQNEIKWVKRDQKSEFKIFLSFFYEYS